MNISMNFTSFRRIIRPLAIYSERNRAENPATKVNWMIDESVQLVGYQSPKYQNRLSVIQFHGGGLSGDDYNYRDFSTKVPTTRGLGTATGGREFSIRTKPGQDGVLICSEDFTYKFKKYWNVKDMELSQHYLPMKQIKVCGTLSSMRLKKYIDIAPGGPLRLKIGKNNSIKFVTEGDTDKAFYDLTPHVTVCSDNRGIEYIFNFYLLSEIIEKFPIKKKIKLAVNDDLIRLRYDVGDDLATVSYYQRARIETSGYDL